MKIIKIKTFIARFDSLLSYPHDETQTEEIVSMIFDAVYSDEFFVGFDFVARCLWWPMSRTIRLVSSDLIEFIVNERD